MVSQLPEVTLEFTEKEQKQVLLTSGKSEITLKGLIQKSIRIYKKFPKALH